MKRLWLNKIYLAKNDLLWQTMVSDAADLQGEKGPLSIGKHCIDNKQKRNRIDDRSRLTLAIGDVKIHQGRIGHISLTIGSQYMAMKYIEKGHCVEIHEHNVLSVYQME